MAAKNVTAVGNAQIDTAQFKFGTASGLFDGTGDYLTIPSDADFAFGTGDFTIEAFIRFNSVANAGFFYFTLAGGSGQPYFQLYSGNLDFGINGVGVVNSTAWSPSANTWYHVAVARSGTTCKTFVDGVQQDSDTDSTNFGQNGLKIASTSVDFNGWMGEIRITKGFARYTGNFTAPTAPFVADAQTVLLLHCEGTDASTTFTDTSDQIPSTGGSFLLNFI